MEDDVSRDIESLFAIEDVFTDTDAAEGITHDAGGIEMEG